MKDLTKEQKELIACFILRVTTSYIFRNGIKGNKKIELICDFANYVANLLDNKTKEQRFSEVAEDLYNNLTTK